MPHTPATHVRTLPFPVGSTVIHTFRSHISIVHGVDISCLYGMWVVRTPMVPRGPHRASRCHPLFQPLPHPCDLPEQAEIFRRAQGRRSHWPRPSQAGALSFLCGPHGRWPRSSPAEFIHSPPARHCITGDPSPLRGRFLPVRSRRDRAPSACRCTFSPRCWADDACAVPSPL